MYIENRHDLSQSLPFTCIKFSCTCTSCLTTCTSKLSNFNTIHVKDNLPNKTEYTDKEFVINSTVMLQSNSRALYID